MAASTRMWWFFFAGFGFAGSLANFSPAPPGRWPLQLAVALFCLFWPTVGHWLLGRYRIRIERKEG